MLVAGDDAALLFSPMLVIGLLTASDLGALGCVSTLSFVCL